MASEWKKVSLREAGVSLIDCVHKTPPASLTGYPYIAIPQLKNGRLDLSNVRLISPEHFIEWTKKANPQPYDVILSRRCNPGETAFVPSGVQAALGQNLVLLRSDGQKVFPPFLRWLVRSPHWWEQVGTFINVGAVFDSLKCADIPNFQLPIPPLDEQKAIAHILGTFDDKIELNQQMNRTLEAIARAIFKSWFIDFDPVRTKMDGRQPAGMDAETAALFPDEFEDSALGKIPKGWKVGLIEDEFKITMGQSPPSSTYNEELDGLPFYQGCRDFSFRYPSVRVHCNAPTRLASAGDTLVSVRAPVGNINMAKDKCCIGRGIAAARHKEGSRSYTYYTMQALNEYFARFEAEGTVFGSMNKKDFLSIPCIIPPKTIISTFEKMAFSPDQHIENQEQQTSTLTSIRDALLPKLLSGEICVKDAEKIVEEVV
ncbi:restriction endonuclease subunit S [Limnospira sp. PMC 1042.18]|uniref:restriction endonuclease subunit S n=1 Tax=Limnospira sp. PMC 1042.18 TaxID=2981018 RepID=UPI0028E17D2C|nr:restriction endonuclease subunit S [Limnospira sp. PMC 1042.18]MDT9197791.1 restriction endonuclease subunit S [Limnospira sp. PMC 1042.18]